MTKNLRAYLQEAKDSGVAIGHFNFSSYDVAKAIILTAKELDVPVILGLSEGERDFVGVNEAVAYVRAIREHVYEKVFLNADHTYSYERVVEVVEAGFDMVIFDGASGDLNENIALTKKCREYITNYNTVNNKDVLLEAELGYIGKSSTVLDKLPDGLQMTDVETAVRFVNETGIDLLAPAIGNVHGMLKSVPDPDLDTERAKSIHDAVHIALVLHGASGNSKEDIQDAIKAGVVIVHINTELRVAYKNALAKYVVGDEVATYKYLKQVEEEVKKVVKEKLEIFNFKV